MKICCYDENGKEKLVFEMSDKLGEFDWNVINQKLAENKLLPHDHPCVEIDRSIKNELHIMTCTAYTDEEKAERVKNVPSIWDLI